MLLLVLAANSPWCVAEGPGGAYAVSEVVHARGCGGAPVPWQRPLLAPRAQGLLGSGRQAR